MANPNSIAPLIPFINQFALCLGERLAGQSTWRDLKDAGEASDGGVELAFDIGVPVGYDFRRAVLSLLIGAASVAIGHYLVNGIRTSMRRQLIAGSVAGCGIATMHYVSLSALILTPCVQYNPERVAVSFLSAIVAATVVLRLDLNQMKLSRRMATAAVRCGGSNGNAMAAGVRDTSDDPSRSRFRPPPWPRPCVARAAERRRQGKNDCI